MKPVYFLMALLVGIFTLPAQVPIVPEPERPNFEDALKMLPADYVVIDNVERRFIPDVVLESEVVRSSYLVNFNWDKNPYQTEQLVIMPASILPQQYKLPSIPVMSATSGGLPGKR